MILVTKENETSGMLKLEIGNWDIIVDFESDQDEFVL